MNLHLGHWWKKKRGRGGISRKVGVSSDCGDSKNRRNNLKEVRRETEVVPVLEHHLILVITPLGGES